MRPRLRKHSKEEREAICLVRRALRDMEAGGYLSLATSAREGTAGKLVAICLLLQVLRKAQRERWSLSVACDLSLGRRSEEAGGCLLLVRRAWKHSVENWRLSVSWDWSADKQGERMEASTVSGLALEETQRGIEGACLSLVTGFMETRHGEGMERAHLSR